MVVGEDEPLLRLFGCCRRAYRLCGHRYRTRNTEREVAVIALIDGFDQLVSGFPEDGRDLKVGNARSTSYVNRTSRQVIAVRHPSDGAIMRGCAINAGDGSVAGRKARGTDGLA